MGLFNLINQGRIQDILGGLGGNSYIICKTYIYIAIIHFIILINKVHVSTYCAWSYSLHTAVPAATNVSSDLNLHSHNALLADALLVLMWWIVRQTYWKILIAVQKRWDWIVHVVMKRA